MTETERLKALKGNLKNWDWTVFPQFKLEKEDGQALIALLDMNWIPIDVKLPENDTYILLSFSNFSVPEVGRYEDGAFYAGDDEDPLIKCGIVVNAWMPLPKCYEVTL